MTPFDSKRIKLGASVGRKPIISLGNQAVITDVLIRLDRANRGKGVREAIQAHPARGLLPAHGAAQVREGPHWARYGASHDNEADRLHCAAAVALVQGKASQVVYTDDHIAHNHVSGAHGSFLVKPNIPNASLAVLRRKELARLNGPDGKGGVFEDLEAHFILCSDEACLMAGARGA